VTTSLRAIGGGPVILAVLMLQVAMASQSFAQSAAIVRPVLGISHVYDSNLFASPDRPEGYFVMRMTPGVEAERRSPMMGLLGRYTVDLEHLAQPSAMTAAVSGQAAMARMNYQASRRLSASVEGAFMRTRSPGELSPVPGLTLGRVTAERLEVHPKIVRDLAGLMSGTIEYTFTRDRASGIGAMLSHRTAVGLDRRISRRDVVGVAYDIQRITFDAADDQSTHRVRAGWNRPITRLANIAVNAGAASTGRTITPDIQASVGHRLRSAEVEMTYGRTQTTILGVAGLMDTESLGATGTLHPQRGLLLRFAPAVSRLRQGGGRLDAWRLGFDVERRVQYGQVRASYEASVQRGTLFSHMSVGSILRHMVQVGFSLSPIEASCELCNMQRDQ
jgi:hypothetical protein